VAAQEDDLGDEPLLEDFRLLRRRIFKWSGARLWQLFEVCGCMAHVPNVMTHAA
jgi:hypothetical protein